MYTKKEKADLNQLVGALMRERGVDMLWLADTVKIDMQELQICLADGWWLSVEDLRDVAEALEVNYTYLDKHREIKFQHRDSYSDWYF